MLKNAQNNEKRHAVQYSKGIALRFFKISSFFKKSQKCLKCSKRWNTAQHAVFHRFQHFWAFLSIFEHFWKMSKFWKKRKAIALPFFMILSLFKKWRNLAKTQGYSLTVLHSMPFFIVLSIFKHFWEFLKILDIFQKCLKMLKTMKTACCARP